MLGFWEHLLWVALNDHSVALASSSTGSQQGELLVLMNEPVGSGGHQAASSGPKGVTKGEGSSPEVHFIIWDGPDLGRIVQLVLGKLVRAHGGLVGQDLTGKGLVDLKHPNVGELEPSLLEQLVGGVGRAQQQLILGVLRNVDVVTEVSEGLVTELLGLALRHQENSRGTVGQKGGVSSRHGSVGLHEGGFQGRELLQGGFSSDSCLLG